MNIYTKFCHKCGLEQPVSEFHKHSTTKDGLQPKCKSCAKIINQDRYAKNKDKFSARNKTWNQSNKNKCADSQKVYRSKNIEKCIIATKKWVKENPDKVNVKVAKYKAAKIQATPSWSETKQIQVLYKEAKRIEKETGIKQHVDHIVPQQSKFVCGLHVLANLRIIPASENCSKGNRHWPDMP